MTKVIEFKDVNEKKVYTSAPNVDVNLLERFLELKKEHEKLENQKKVIESEMNELRTKILSQLPGEVKDKVQTVIDGIEINKYSRNKSEKIDEEKAIDLAKKLKVLSKVAEKKWVLDNKKFKEVMRQKVEEGKLKQEEYNSLIQQAWIPVLVVKDLRTESEIFDKKNTAN